MKRFSAAMVILFLFLHIGGQAQKINELPNADTIPSYPLSICFNKTTNLVFPFKIKSVDRGSKDLLVQKAKTVENVLQLKGAKENFAETNLSVITDDGKLYSFTIHYANQPGVLNFLFFKDSSLIKDPVSAFSGVTNKAIMEMHARSIINQKRSVFRIRDKKFGMRMRLTGLFVRNDILYFQLQLQNRSNIDYDIDMLHFFIQDKRQARRTASQELPVQVLYVYGNNLSVKGDTRQSIVYALPKFTIPDKKWFYVQMMERNGGRHLQLKIGNGTILKAKLLPGNSTSRQQ